MLPDKIHFGVIVKGHVAEMHEMPFPEVGPTDIVVKLIANNICTTDYQQWMGLRDHQGFPMAGGHECAGVIVAKGDEVFDNFEIGQQVATMHPFCGMCDNCRQGHTGDCVNVGGHGGPGPDGYYGGAKRFADYVVMDQKLIVPINNDIAPAEAGFLEPVATVVQGAHKVNIQPMQDVVVIGAGTMGLVNAQVAKAFGARVMISDISPKKIARAKEMGVDVIDAKNNDPVQAVKDLTGGKGADIVIAAVGSSIAYKQGYEMLKQLRGKLLIFPAGYPKPELHVDPNELHYRKLELIGTFGCDLSDWYESATLISKRLINCSYSLEGKFIPLRDIQKAYEAAATPDSYRVTVDLQSV